MNWHTKSFNAREFEDRLADLIAGFIGSWTFLIVQCVVFVIWVLVNTLYYFQWLQFDPYPFILFNLFMSAESALGSPLILMSQNQQSRRDRHQAEEDFKTTQEAKLEIETLQREIARIESAKLDKIIALLEEPTFPAFFPL